MRFSLTARNRQILAYATCIVLILGGWLYNRSLDIPATEDYSEVKAKGKILAMQESDQISDGEEAFPFAVQYDVTLEIKTGPYKGNIVETKHYYNNDLYYDVLIEPGDNVILTLEIEDDQLKAAHVSDFERAPYLWFLFVLFILAILFIGKKQGVKTVLSLILTGMAVIYILLPAILAGKDPITVTIIVCTGITLVTHMLITGFTRKSVAAVSGTFFGILVGGILAQNVIHWAHISGLSSEESRMFYYGYGDGAIDITGLLFAGIVLGSLGAVMDVAMSIASAMQEIQDTDPTIHGTMLVKRGLNVGRDIIGTMSNTLILANTGSALPLMLLIQANQIDYVSYINMDMIATEIIRSLSGSIGLFLAVPFTALISAMLYASRRRRKTKALVSEEVV